LTVSIRPRRCDDEVSAVVDVLAVALGGWFHLLASLQTHNFYANEFITDVIKRIPGWPQFGAKKFKSFQVPFKTNFCDILPCPVLTSYARVRMIPKKATQYPIPNIIESRR